MIEKKAADTAGLKIFFCKLFPSSKPDADNILKICEDALNGVAYVDDRYIYELHIRKVYDERERIEVVISDENG